MCWLTSAYAQYPEVVPSNLPLICLPGWGVSAAIWDALQSRLCGEVDVRPVNLPGQGGAEVAQAGLQAWTQSILDDAPEHAIYLGWSLGGLVCLRAASQHPQRVAGLILVDSLPRLLRGPDWPWGMKSAAVDATARGLEGDYEKTLQQFLSLQILSEPGASHRVHQLQADLLSQPPSRAGLMQGLDILHATDLRADLARIQAPTLVINGKLDRMCHPDGARWTAEHIAGAQSWLVDGAAHAPFLSNSAQFSTRIAEFVAAIAAAR